MNIIAFNFFLCGYSSLIARMLQVAAVCDIEDLEYGANTLTVTQVEVMIPPKELRNQVKVSKLPKNFSEVYISSCHFLLRPMV